MTPFFAALIALVNENGSDYFTLQTEIVTQPTLIDNGVSRTYTTLAQLLTNIQVHRITLQTSTGATTKTTQARNLKVRIGNESLFLPALRVPTLTDNLISAVLLDHNFNLTFIKDYVYLSKMDPLPTHAKILGRRTAQNI